MAAKKAPAKKMAAPAKAAPKKKTSSDTTIAGRNLSPTAQQAMRNRNKIGGGFGETREGSLAKTFGNVVKQQTGKTLSPSEQMKGFNTWFDARKVKGLSSTQRKALDTVMKRAYDSVVNVSKMR